MTPSKRKRGTYASRPERNPRNGVGAIWLFLTIPAKRQSKDENSHEKHAVYGVFGLLLLNLMGFSVLLNELYNSKVTGETLSISTSI